jgi:hypothetical protein
VTLDGMANHANDDGEGWTMVSPLDKKRVMRKRGKRIQRHRDHLTSTPATTAISTMGIAITSIQTLRECVQTCLSYLEKTQVWKNILSLVLSEEIQQIICYGIGNFSHTSTTYFSASLWQLTCIKKLQQQILHDQKDGMKDVSILYHDPCTLDIEKEYLEINLPGYQWIDNDRGNRQIDVATLFFMPHCPSRMYENVIFANWDNLPNVVVLGNSLRTLADDYQVRTVDSPCLRTLLPFLKETRVEATRQDTDSAPGNLIGAFNDTYISRCNAIENTDVPKRPYETILDNENDAELL